MIGSGSEREISRDEREKFAKYLYRYGYGDVIIREGQADTSLYLLRVGSVGVFKNTMGEQKQIATIEAVNIFGEIASIIESPRTATVWVTSAEAVIYKFPTFDLKAIYSNPAWAELLITRLCNDVKDSNNRNAALEEKYNKLTHHTQENLRQIEVLFSALIRLQRNLALGAVMNSKEWQFLVGLREMTLAFVQKFLPDIYARTGDDGSDAAVETLIDKGIMPEHLKYLYRKPD
jgi:CRP-like cAMP-binding protein